MIRLRLTRAPDGKSPKVTATRIFFDSDPKAVVTLANDEIRIRFDRRTGKLLTLERLDAVGVVNQAWQATPIFDVSLKKPNHPEITVLEQDDAKLVSVKEIDPGKRALFEYSLSGRGLYTMCRHLSGRGDHCGYCGQTGPQP